MSLNLSFFELRLFSHVKLNALHFGYCCHADAGAHSGEFIYGLESFVYKDVKPGGYTCMVPSLLFKSIALLSAPVPVVGSVWKISVI